MNKIKTMLTHIMNHKHHSSTEKKDSPKSHDNTIPVPANKKVPPLEGGHCTKIGGMWTLKYEIRSPKFYELLIKIELKGYTALDLKNFYNHIKMCLNVLTRPREYLLTAYQSFKIHSDFEDYLVPYRDQTFYSWNSHTYKFL